MTAEPDHFLRMRRWPAGVMAALLLVTLALPLHGQDQQPRTVHGPAIADSLRIVALRDRAMAEIRQDRLRAGRLLLEEAVRGAEAMGNAAFYHGMLLHLASVNEAEGALARALELLLACLAYHRERGNVRESALLHLNIGNLYNRIGEPERALAQHRRAAAMSEGVGTPYMRGRIQYALGCDFESAGLLDSAETCFMMAERIADAANDREGIGQARTRLGGLRIRQGRLKEARHDFDRVLALTGLDESPLVIAQAWRGQGQIQAAAGEYDKAVESFERAAELSEHAGLRALRLDILTDLAASHEQMGEYYAAYRVAQQQAAARDSLFVTQNRQQMNELLARYEAEQREQQILMLEKDNRLKASELQREQLLARERAAQIELLAGQNAIQHLRLDLAGAELRQQEIESREKEQRLLVEKKENKLQKAVLDRQRYERMQMISGFIVLALVSVLLVRNILLRRRASEARADAAELRAEAAANESLLLRAEIAERARESQKRFSRELLRAQEEERQRIASDLHDSLAQKLVVIQNRATLARKNTGSHEEASGQFGRIADIAVDTIAEIRAISHALRPLLLRRFGLSAALRGLVEELDGASDLRWTAEIDDLAGVFDVEEEINLYRIVQEAANNTMRHAHARSAKLTVRRSPGSIHVELSDDGGGMHEPTPEHKGSVKESGMGIDGMRHRAELLGATMHIDSAPGHGTRIVLDIPSKPSPP